MTLTEEELRNLGSYGDVVSTSGDKIGRIGQIYVDDDTSEPSFVTATTGLFGLSQSFVPLRDARLDGGDIVVPFDKDVIKDAPRIDDDGHLTPAEEEQLYRYYGLGGDGTEDVDRTPDRRPATDVGGQDHDHRDAGTDRDLRDDHDLRDDDDLRDENDRTDDRDARDGPDLREGDADRDRDLGDEHTSTGRTRLRRYTVTEKVAADGTTEREEIRVERDLADDSAHGAR